MKLKQLSVFLENKPGRLTVPCRALADAGVNILTLSLADTQQFGILRLIVRDWQGARAILEQVGCVVNVTEVVAVEIADRPGGIAQVLDVLEQLGLNVEYVYAFAFRRKDRAILVFRFDDPDAAVEALQSRGVSVIGNEELYARMG